MGDRALLQIVNSKVPTEFGPVMYLHWGGSDVPSIVAALAKRMKGREADVDYASARLAQECMHKADGNTGYGIWNAKAKLTEADSHGDAGVVLIDCAGGFKCECMGGYLRVGSDGFPTE